MEEERVWTAELQHVCVLQTNELDFHMSVQVITVSMLMAVTLGNEVSELVQVRL
jgi:two-component sensor histidine kinase